MKLTHSLLISISVNVDAMNQPHSQENIEEIINKQIVANVLEKIPDNQRNALLEKTMTKALEGVFSTWQVDRAIKEDAERYMAEYIRMPEVQAKIKAGVEEAFDRILSNMVEVFEKQINHTIASEYVSFRKKE